MAKPVRKSPILGAVSAMIDDASGRLVTSGAKFRHSFEVELSLIDRDPAQPRTLFQDAELQGLAATLEAQGQLQPVLLRRNPENARRWMIVAGERRCRAAQLLGWTHILAFEHVGDAEVVALIENLQRVDLSPVEEARGLARLIRDKGWSQDRLAAAVGKSKSEISASLRILSLPEDVLDRVLTSELPLAKNVLVEIARIEDAERQRGLIETALTNGLTIRAIREAKPVPTEPGEPTTPVGPLENAARSLRRTVTLLRAARAAQETLPPEIIDALAALRDEIDDLIG